MDLWILLVLAIAGVAGTVEVHFENKDGGFFLKHTPRQYYPAVADLAGTGSSSPPASSKPPPGAAPGPSILSVDRFTVFQNTQPISIRATYGPFSTKQTVPARYIVPDPLDSLPPPAAAVPPPGANVSTSPAASALDVDAAVHHLDMSAHVVRGEVARDSPVLRVLFHAGSEAALGRHQMALLARHQRVCIVLHAAIVDRPPLTAACSPDGEDGVCLAQVTVPASWWPPLPAPGGAKPAKTPPRVVQVSFSVLEPRAGDEAGCTPRVQIQPVTPLASVPLVGSRAAYRELRADDVLSLLLPHAPLYPLSRLHVPVYVRPAAHQHPVAVIVIRARVKTGLRLLGAEASSDLWNVSVELNPKHTVATVTAVRREDASELQDDDPQPPPQPQKPTTARSEEVFTWLVEVVEDSADLWDGGRLVWSVRYVLEGADRAAPPRPHPHHRQHHHRTAPAAEEARRKISARLEIQKDDIQSVLPISKNWDVINTAVLTGRQVSQAMKVFIVSQAGKVADVTLQSSCHSEDESVLKVSSSCSSVYVDGSEIRGSSNASVLVKYGTYTGLARFTVWMPEFPLEVAVADFRLSQVKGWKVPDDHSSSGKLKQLSDDYRKGHMSMYRGWTNAGSMLPDDMSNGLDSERHTTCRIRFQQSPVEVYSRFLATDHDSSRVSYFVNRRTSLRVTDLVLSLLRVSDPRIASLHGRILQGRSMGRTEVQVLSPITGRVIGAKEVRVGNDKVSISRLQVRVVSGLQLSITPDTAVENGYIAETSVTRKLTAQYQEGLLDIDLEFSDGSRTPLRDVAVTDYYLLVESLDPEVVAFAPMVASHHPRVIAVGEGQGDLLHVALLLAEDCRSSSRRMGAGKGGNGNALASASASVEVDFSASDIPQRPDFVQNDGGGNIGGTHNLRDRKLSRDMPADNIHPGIQIKDENNHEPTVQARQHHSIVANGMSAGMGLHHHNNMHMTPLEIGLYVLLAAFCFAIVVFVVSCVVYASKFKPQPIDAHRLPLSSSSSGGLQSLGGISGKVGINAGLDMSSSSGSGGPPGSRKQLQESTTNAHDWVWLGRATLERSSGHVVVGAAAKARMIPPAFSNNNNVIVPAPKEAPQMCITANPMSYSVRDIEEEHVLGTCFDNPNHIDLPSKPPAVDSATYCKKEKVPSRQHFAAQQSSPSRQPHFKSQHKDLAPEKLWQIAPSPPPLPPHGVPFEKQPIGDASVASSDNSEYKPPVPPHRNIGVTARIGPSRQQPGPLPGFLPQQGAASSRRHHHHHHHHRSSGGGGGSHHHRSSRATQEDDPRVDGNQLKLDFPAELQPLQRHNPRDEVPPQKNYHKRQSKEDRYHIPTREHDEDKDCLQNTSFIDFQSAGMASGSRAQRRGNSPEVKRATIVGNPMFSAAEGMDEDVRLREDDLQGLEDLSLEMNYDQIMEYFDNLKESNA